MDSNIGKKLDGRYEITELIGVGGMADVYKAVDVMEDREVAVKILKPEFAENEEFLRRFRNESKAIAVLSHPNIVKIYDVGFSDEIQYIVMEYIDGITLKEFIEQQGVLKWKDALHFVTQILRALQHAHDKGIVHRDIKPQNIMLFTDGTIKVMDFGIARFSRIDGKTLSDKTIGSVHYISPEQARGDITDERSDIYSVGAMLYEMLTGHKPFDGENPVAIALKHMQDDLVMPRDIMPSVPEALEEIVIHAMEKDPGRRYQSAADMIRDIDTFKLNQSVVFGYKNGAAPVNTEYYDDDYDDDYYDDRYDSRYDRYDDDDYDDDDYDEDDYEPPKKRSYIMPILLAVTVAVVIMASVIICITVFKSLGGANGLHTSSVEVPNFVGMSIVDVEQEWKDKLQFEITNENNNEYESGIIFWQADAVGKTVKEGYTCTIKVSKGKQMTTIPNMVNKPKEAAESELKAAGFVVFLTSEFNDDVPKGNVTKTEPAAGTEFYVGGTVKIFVSDGPFDTQVKVPNVVGYTQDKAVQALKDNKLNPVIKEVGHDGDKGLVISQSIEKDTRVTRGSDVIIYISKGEVDESSLTFRLPIPNGAFGSYSVVLYNNAKVVATVPMDKAETVAGSYLEVTVKGKKEQSYTIHVRNNTTGKSVAPYAVVSVDFEKKTAKFTSGPNTSKLLDITPTTTPETTKATETTTEEPTQTETQTSKETEPTETKPTDTEKTKKTQNSEDDNNNNNDE